jgi:exodeoxyribonuclease III
MGKQYDGVRARAPNRIVDVDAAPRDARARERGRRRAMTDNKRAVDAEETRGDARAKKPKGSTTKSDAARRIQPGTRALDDGRRACVVIAWNIAGLRSFYDKSLERLEALVRREDPDVVVMQEHKLQVAHAGAFTEKLRKRFPKHACVRFAVSVVKKGYSGVVVMCKSREGKRGGGGQTTLDDAFGAKEAKEAKAKGEDECEYDGPRLVSIEEGLGSRGYTDEGRTLTLEFDGFYLVTAYVPNSGQDLKRLGYRIDEWERDMRAHLKELDAKKPVVYVGDLNVAHRDEDIWNVTASHIKKSAGTTPQEREAFGVMLEENKLVDAFRFFHEGATGWFSYWSVRAGNRPFNKGLRLDYTLASRRLFDGGSDGVEVVDAFILDEYQGSDHCPVGITLAV